MDWSLPVADGAAIVTVSAAPPAQLLTEKSAQAEAPGDPPPALALWTDKPGYQRGDAVVIHAVADRACHLTVINVDAQGAATVVFPNAFQKDNRIEAGVAIELPGKAAPFTFRARKAGRELVLAICDTSATPPLAIEPDWERRRFTVLGNWHAYVSGTFAGTPPVLLEPAPPSRTSSYARRGASEPAKIKPDPFRPAGRAAVGYEVK